MKSCRHLPIVSTTTTHFCHFTWLLFLPLLIWCTLPTSSSAKQRVIILTDISAPDKEPDDLESMVRLMLYSNELDIEGLIATSSCWRKNESLRPDLITDVVDAYEKVRPNLLLHASGFPEASALRKVIRQGNGHGMEAVGEGKTTAGSDLIITALSNTEERSLWICIWGGAATLAQALFDLRKTYTQEETQRYISRIRVYDLSGQDDAGAWICHEFPGIFYIRSRFQWRGFSYRLDGLWTDSRGADESLVAPEWFREHIIENHGPLGALYPQGKYLYEGDTPTFLNLLNTGLTAEPDHIDYGGWGGRFESDPKKNVRTGSDNTTVVETDWDDYAMFTDASDRWSYDGKEYDNAYCAVFRWRTACQSDFAARMDWCAASYDAANHRPHATVNGDTTTGFITIIAEPGSSVELDAAGSDDPDGDSLRYLWRIYTEAGSYNGMLSLTDTVSMRTTVTMPQDCIGKSVHIILEVSDNGSPSCYAYRRIILTGSDASGIAIRYSGDDTRQTALVDGAAQRNPGDKAGFWTLDGRKIAEYPRPIASPVIGRFGKGMNLYRLRVDRY